MRFSNFILRVLSAIVGIFAMQIVAGALLALFPTKAVVPTVPHILLWLFLNNVVIVTALSIVALRTEWRGWKVGVALAAIPLIVVLTNGIEGIIFLKNSQIDWPRIFLQSGITAILSMPVWMLLFGKRPADPQEHYHPIGSKARSERAWRFVVSDLTYTILYFSAGMIVFPYVKDFYANQLPQTSTVLAVQLLLRGPVFVMLCLLLVRMLGLPRLNGALAVGVVFTLVSGVAPLIMPNPYFPDSVRWAHFCEVTTSNFAFAAVVGWLWGQRKLAPLQTLQQAA